MKENKGSIWRIWDMHIHSPATYGGEYKDFIANATSSIASVIGINDYCTIKGYEEIIKLGGVPGKVIFPVIELRMNNVLQTKHKPNGIKINFHIIFNNDETIIPTIANWLQSLPCLNEKGDKIQLGIATDLKKVSFDFDTVRDSLIEYNLYLTHALIWLPYDEYGGIDEIDPVNDGPFKLSLIKKTNILGSSTKKQIDFFKWEDPKYTNKQFLELLDKKKPCIKGSDAHKINYPFGQLQNHLSQPTDKYCWINADMTFLGLKQIIVEPDRVFIGDEPPLLKRVKANQTKFIRSLEVFKTSTSTIDEVWFDNYKIRFNSGLVAIIGNKGGGKSAITDIISLCGNTHQEPTNFSFLTDKKFRKQKPYNLSERFQATLTWEEETKVSKKLNENPDKNLSERVKYIPQNFLERLCANVESDDFEKEIKQIIYSHTPIDKRLGKPSLDDLINYKSSLINDEIKQLQIEISKINVEIVSLEQQSTTDYRKSVNDKLKLKNDELTALLANKPIEPIYDASVPENLELTIRLTDLRGKMAILEAEIALLTTNKVSLTLKLEELNRSIHYYKNVDDQLKKVVDSSNEYVQITTKYNLDNSSIFSYQVNTTIISDVIETVNKDIETTDILLSSDDDRGKVKQLNTLLSQLLLEQEELDKPAKEKQKYLNALKEWETQKASIEGSITIEGSMKYLEGIITFLNVELEPKLANHYSERRKLVVKLYDKKTSLIEIRKQLFEPVTSFIDEYQELKARYDVKLDVALELRSFADGFFTYINQQRIGTFAGKEDGYKRLTDFIEKSSFSSSDSFIIWADELIDNLKKDKRSSANSQVNIETQLRQGVELNALYDFIYNFDYIQPVYNLKLGAKTLQELSPGERGALLLIFYLILDNDDIPLIIDQPEENLDNESVYHILVHFIKKVKERRQIILVTHNPNLAIVCDADQIIHMQIEKENKNTVKFYSGGIEDPTINKTVLNILEGTLPAFNNRDLKYVR